MGSLRTTLSTLVFSLRVYECWSLEPVIEVWRKPCHCRTLHTLHHNDGDRCRTASVIPTSLPACLPACLPAYPGRLPEDACSSRALASLGFYHVLAVMMTTTRILLLAVSSSAFRRLRLPQQHSGLPRLRRRAPRVRANGRGTATEGPTPSSYSRQNISSWNLVLTINNSDKSHDHLVKGQTVKVRKTSSFFLLLADILSDAIFQVSEQRVTSLLTY